MDLHGVPAVCPYAPVGLLMARLYPWNGCEHLRVSLCHLENTNS